MGVKRWLLWLPFAGFLLVLGVVAGALMKPADHEVHSALVGQPLPTFSLPPIVPSKPGVGSADFHQGAPRLLNVFASWCIPCIAEAPQLVKLKNMGISIDAVAVRDTGPAIAAFLQTNGDPYERIGDDKQSAVQLSLGSSGVPETFVIDGQGRVVLQHIGDIRAEEVDDIAAAVRGAR